MPQLLRCLNCNGSFSYQKKKKNCNGSCCIPNLLVVYFLCVYLDVVLYYIYVLSAAMHFVWHSSSLLELFSRYVRGTPFWLNFNSKIYFHKANQLLVTSWKTINKPKIILGIACFTFLMPTDWLLSSYIK